MATVNQRADEMVDVPDQAETAAITTDKQCQILNGAAAVFARDGYEGASMSRIAAEAGVSKGTLYNYFTCKAELFAEYVHRDCTRRVALVFDDLDYAGLPERTLAEVGRRMITMLVSEHALVMHRMVVAEAEKFPELARSFYQSGPAPAVAHLAAYLRHISMAGLLDLPDPEFAAEQFFALIQTRLYMKRQLRLTMVPSAVQIDHVVDGAVRLFTRGYAPARCGPAADQPARSRE